MDAEMSRLLRCISCHRGSPKPPHGTHLKYTDPTKLTKRQRRNNLCSFNEGDPNMVPHIAETGHNEWEHLSHTTGEWVYLGPYRGDGYFMADESSAPPYEE